MVYVRTLNAFFFTLVSVVLCTCAIAAQPPSVLKAKQQAEIKGFLFETHHDEIIVKAKNERKLKVLSYLDREGRKAMADAFTKKYPFIEVETQEIGGTDEYQRFLPELKTGKLKLDITHIPNHFYEEYVTYLKKFDILGMAERKVLDIPVPHVDSVNRNIVAMATNIAVVAYNNKAIPAAEMPNSWEGFLTQKFNGGKFVADIRPLGFAGLVPAWGLDKTLEFTKKIAAHKPIWTRGSAKPLASLASGEYSVLVGFNYGTIKRAQEKDPTRTVAYKIIEPVPVRFAGMAGILATAEHPYASLLWLEFQQTADGQKLVDKYWPYGASVFVRGASQEEVIRGKKLSVMSWEHRQEMDEWLTKVVQSLGFPAGETKN